ncbi:hypothetical protein vBPFY1MI_138 [Pseudomonas phage vB_PF_Y1-MI]|nr:hypothetical protein vBPFY1MI_138 [Pseudomonas phage vB_PF_Y1-MI]
MGNITMFDCIFWSLITISLTGAAVISPGWIILFLILSLIF